MEVRPTQRYLRVNGRSRSVAVAVDYGPVTRRWKITMSIAERVAIEDSVLGPGLAHARALERLGMGLREVDDPQQAVTLVRQAVEILRLLHDDDPARYQLDFADASLNLALCLSDVGDHPAAIAHATGAVEVYRRLARLEHAAYTHILSTALRNLGVIFFHAGELRSAQPVARESVTMLHNLADMDPPAYGADLADSLSNLSAVLSALDDTAGALAAAEEAAQRFREYTGDQDVVHARQRALVNLGECQAAAGDLTAAGATTRQGVDELRQLSSREANVYEPTLAVALHNLGTWLYRADEHESALAAVQEAVEIRQRLAAREPDAHLDELAATLRLLAVVTAYRHSSPGPALEPARESVVIARRAAKRDSAVHAAGLVESLDLLARTCHLAGELVEGRAAAEAALALAHRLSTQRPDLYSHKAIEVQAVLDRVLWGAAASPVEQRGLTAIIATEQAVKVLGRDGLATVATQLWPVDCQGCGESLAGTTPALHIETFAGTAVSLYHPNCEAALATSGLYAIIPSPSWCTRAILLSDLSYDQQPDWPIVILNPSLERVVIERDAADQWRVAIDGCVRGVGLLPTGPDLTIRRDRPLQDCSALLTSRESVAVNLDRKTYEVPLTEALRAAVRQLNGLVLVVSHATWPSVIVRSDHFRELLGAGTAAIGWVPLREPSAVAR